jgi:hypothetical protein
MASRGDCFLALSSHLSVLPYSLPPSYRCALSTGPTNSESSSLKLRTPTAFSDRKAPFCAPSRRRPNSLPGHPEAPPPGFGYPLGGVSRPDPWKPISSSNTLGVHLSELLPLRWSKNGFAFSLRPCTFHIDRSGLHAVLRRFSSHRESCIPYSAFRTINPERDLSALQGFSPLRFSLSRTDGKSIFLFPFPSHR